MWTQNPGQRDICADTAIRAPRLLSQGDRHHDVTTAHIPCGRWWGRTCGRRAAELSPAGRVQGLSETVELPVLVIFGGHYPLSFDDNEKMWTQRAGQRDI